MTIYGSGGRPIGFWLKLIDGLIDDGFEKLLGGADLTRRHWQILNILNQRSLDLDEADGALRPFLDGGETSVLAILEDLIRRGWAAETEGRWSLTTVGLEGLDDLSSEIGEFRKSVADGISGEDYWTAIGVLERMAVNLGWNDTRPAQE